MNKIESVLIARQELYKLRAAQRSNPTPERGREIRSRQAKLNHMTKGMGKRWRKHSPLV